MNTTLAAHLPSTLLTRWEIDAQIEKEVKKNNIPDKKVSDPNTWTPLKPKEPESEDGFTIVTKSRKKHTTTHAKPVAVNASCYTQLPSGKPTQKQGSLESATAKKNRKRAEKRKLAPKTKS
jgi:hypothetical protein